MGVAHALPEREDMTDDWKRRDDTGNRDAEGYGTDFGDDFGTVQFGDEAVEPVCHLVTTLGLFRIGPSHLLVNFLSFCSQNLQTTPMYGRLFHSPQCNLLLHPSRRIAMSPRAKHVILKTMQRRLLVHVVNHAWS